MKPKSNNSTKSSSTNKYHHEHPRIFEQLLTLANRAQDIPSKTRTLRCSISTKPQISESTTPNAIPDVLPFSNPSNSLHRSKSDKFSFNCFISMTASPNSIRTSTMKSLTQPSTSLIFFLISPHLALDFPHREH
ncbi:hypothetical protein Droror1_Dr00027007 [Drosera rotundifolia]